MIPVWGLSLFVLLAVGDRSDQSDQSHQSDRSDRRGLGETTV